MIKNKINKKYILGTIESRKEKLKAKKVQRIGLFGSFLRGDEKRGSDLDFLVEFEKNEIGNNYFEVLSYLENLFKRKVDLIPIENLRKELNYVKEEAEFIEI